MGTSRIAFLMTVLSLMAGAQQVPPGTHSSSDRDHKLCLYFDGYQGVQLMGEQDALWCKGK
jgi:hypothetical protein